MMKRFLSILALMLLGVHSHAQVPVVPPVLSEKTCIAPAFFGPNAFPVPEMNDGTITGRIAVTAAYDFFRGTAVSGKDMTQDAFLRIDFPIIPKVAGLSVWMPVVEWWNYGEEAREYRRLVKDKPRGYDSGDVYVSTDLRLLEEKGFLPSVVVRTVLKTASGNSYGSARYYDAPGYFVDLTAGKAVEVSGSLALRASASVGFLCWQTDRGRQNDAVQYGVMVKAILPHSWISAQIAGYSGWEHCGDEPLTLNLNAVLLSDRCISPVFGFQYGLRDWPFCQLRAGIRYNFTVFSGR